MNTLYKRQTRQTRNSNPYNNKIINRIFSRSNIEYKKIRIRKKPIILTYAKKGGPAIKREPAYIPIPRFSKKVKIQNLLKKQKHKCQICKSKIKFDKYGYQLFDMDHIKPIYMGGSDRLSNLQLLCCGCHREKTNLDIEKYNKLN